MSRSIVVCIDGTNNFPSGGYTNIQRLFRILIRDAQQITYYQPGAGTIEPGSVTTSLGRRLAMTLDAASAWMMQRHVCDAYRYLMEEYQPGDRLHFLGFSRGAFCVRVLAGMLTKIGLLHRGFANMVDFAWKAYVNPHNTIAARDFRAAYSRPVEPITFLGLFDTVSAVGAPWDPIHFPLSYDNRAVQCVRHAQSLDERRVMFVQNRWAPDDASIDVKQVWFAGVHADIGGGYPEQDAGLSRIPLAWMLREISASTMLGIDTGIAASILDPSGANSAPDVRSVATEFACAPIHDELKQHLLWRFAEHVPVPRKRFDKNGQRWVRKYEIHNSRPRTVYTGTEIHESVRLRMEAAAYLPAAALHDPSYVW